MNVAVVNNIQAPNVQMTVGGDGNAFMQQLMGAMQLGDADAFMQILSENIVSDENLSEDFMKNNVQAMQMMLAELMGVMSNVNNYAVAEYETTEQIVLETEKNPIMDIIINLKDKISTNDTEPKDELIKFVDELSEKLNVEVVAVPKNEKKEENIFKGFDKNVAIAKKNMGDSKIKTATNSDLAALGSMSNANVHNVVSKDVDLSKISAKVIVNQIETGIKEGIKQKDNNLVIKLRPEGLGEVTVKMTEVGGKITLDIVTASQYARNALNTEIDALRENLKQYNAEIASLATADGGFSFGEDKGDNAQGKEQRQNGQHIDYVEETDFTDDKLAMEEYVRSLTEALSRYYG